MGVFVGRKSEHPRQAGRRVPADRRRHRRAGRGTVPLRTRISAALSSRRRRTRRRASRSRSCSPRTRTTCRSPCCPRRSAPPRAGRAGLVLGPPTGYVVKFTNGLVAYLSGDTGIHTEMKTVVNEYHKANLALINLGPSAVTVDVGRLCDERARPAGVGHPHPSERGGDRRRQTAPRFPRSSARQAAEARRTSRSAGGRWSSTAADAASRAAEGGGTRARPEPWCQRRPATNSGRDAPGKGCVRRFRVTRVSTSRCRSAGPSRLRGARCHDGRCASGRPAGRRRRARGSGRGAPGDSRTARRDRLAPARELGDAPRRGAAQQPLPRAEGGFPMLDLEVGVRAQEPLRDFLGFACQPDVPLSQD